MLDFIYHMTLKLIKNRIFGVKTSRFCHLLRNAIIDVIMYQKSVSYYRFIDFIAWRYNHSQTRRHVIKYLFSVF